MSIATEEPASRAEVEIGPEQRLDFDGISWDRYLAMSDAFPDHAGARMVYIDGRLTFATTSRRHDFLSDCLGDIVKAIAIATGLGYAVAGRATFRRQELGVGVEGDETFYLGENARRMRGGINIDLATQPPPDLVIEVEVSNPADLSIAAWGRLGVPEVWRLKVNSWELEFLVRQPGGNYLPQGQSVGLSTLTPIEVLELLHAAEKMDSAPWYVEMHEWVRNVLMLRQQESP